MPGSWGNWTRLGDLRPGHPAFVIRRIGDGHVGGGRDVLDTQRWGIGGDAGGGPTTRILGVSQPWWRRLAERPAQRCLIPVTACTVPVSPHHDRDGTGAGDRRPTWFGLTDEPVFTIAGLWRDSGETRCFAMLGGVLSQTDDAPFPVMPVVIAPEQRDRWLDAPWETAAPLMTPCAPARMRIGLPEPASALYAETGHDRPWPPAPTQPRHRPRR